MTERSAIYDLAFFAAAMSTALALGGALAHLYELPNKIPLSREAYFVVQSIYSGWNRIAFVILVQFISIVVVAVISYGTPRVFWPTILALTALVAAQAVFWTFTYPANVATQNWTMIPDNWNELRRMWEYSHAAGAIFQLISMGALVFALIRRAHI